ncbi:MAG: DUF4350 domain-containing protein [Candidatus Heimdallarchaeota archaeon]
MARKFDRNAFILTMIFIIFCLPILLSVTRIGREETRQFSIYNTGWDGTSTLRTQLESQGFEFHPIISTLNTLTRVDTMGVLALIGPTIFFDPTETAALAYYIMRGGSVIIADDFGRANDILGLINSVIAPFLNNINLSALGIESFPLAGIKINQSLLCDPLSNYISPVMPIIRSFHNIPGGPDVSGLSSVITSFPSSISFLGYDAEDDRTFWSPNINLYVNNESVGSINGMLQSSNLGWLESDIAAAREGDLLRSSGEWNGTFGIMLPLGLAGAGVGNILICSDPSIFINELMEQPTHDNAQLASILFNWLDFNNSRTIYYDESHLSSAQGRAALSIFDPFSYISMYLRYVDSFTMFPLLAPLFPFIAFIFLRRRYPKTRGPSPLLMTKIKQRRSRSFFAAKMVWYLNYQQFDNAVDLLYKRVKRRLQKKFGITEDINSDTIIELLDEHYPDKFNLKEVDKTLKRIEFVTQKSRKISEEEFTDLVLKIKDLEDNTTKSNM